MAKRKVIISCAITGSIHTPSMSPYLPVTAEEIAASALGAAEAGAAIVHLHARNPTDGRPDQSPEAFEPFLAVIKQSSNVVVNLTTGGAPYMTVEERVRPAEKWKPEVASLNMGSMNFGLFPMLKRYKDFKHDWEPKMLEASRDLVFRNSFKDIRYALETLNATGARYEFECYDTSHLYNLHHFFERRPGQAAAVHPDLLRPARRHRRPSRRRDAHEAHRRPAVRRQLSLVGAGRRTQPDAGRGDGGVDGRQRPRRPRGQPVDRSRQARALERRAR